MESKMMPLKFDSEKNSIFVDFSKNISLAFIEKEQEIFKSLVEVFKKFNDETPKVEVINRLYLVDCIRKSKYWHIAEFVTT